MVHAVFYNFADGEVARHIPRVWDITTPEQALAAREQGSAAALRRILGDLADSPGLVRAAELATQAATSAPTEGRVLYAGLRALAVPEEPVARLWQRGDPAPGTPRGRPHRRPGRRTASAGPRPTCSTRCRWACPRRSSAGSTTSRAAQLAAVVDGMRARGLVAPSGWLTAAGLEAKQRVEALTDDLAAPAYDGLEPHEVDELVATLRPISAALDAVGSR